MALKATERGAVPELGLTDPETERGALLRGLEAPAGPAATPIHTKTNKRGAVRKVFARSLDFALEVRCINGSLEHRKSEGLDRFK